MTSSQNSITLHLHLNSGLPELPAGTALLRTAMLVALWALFSCVRTEAAQTDNNQSSWFRITMDGQPIGFEQRTVSNVAGNSNLIKVFRRTEMHVRRLGSTVKLQSFLWTTQTRSGHLQAFDLQRVDAAGNRMERSGIISANKRAMEVTERVAATRSTRSITIQGPVMSPIVELWLPQAMASASSTASIPRQTFPVFFPESVDTASINASIQAFRQMVLPDGKRITAARLEYSIASRPGSPTRMLIAEDLRLIRKEQTLLNRPLILEEASADDALRASHIESLDLNAQAIIPVDRLISFKASEDPIFLKLTVSRGFLGQIPDSKFQTIRQASSASAIIRLTAATYPASVSSRPTGLNPQPLPATTLMPTNDPLLVRMANQATVGKFAPTEVCLSLEEYVGSALTFSPFSTNLLPANTVAKQKRGDCTEHAILLATLVKIRAIPARIVSGLILTPGRPGFSGHVWVEAQIDGQWYPFDSTSPAQSRQIRIKLAHSDFQKNSQSTGLSLFVPILDLAGRSSITVEAPE